MKENDLPLDPEDHYGDGVTAKSDEGRRRAVANLREINRRLGSMTASKATWRHRIEAKIRQHRAAIATGELRPDDVADREARIRDLRARLEASRPKPRAWDFGRGREIASDAAQDGAGGDGGGEADERAPEDDVPF